MSPLQFSGKKITIRCERLPLEDVLDRLTKQSGIRFVYSSSIIEIHKPITLHASDDGMDQVLQAISGQVGITFKRQGNYVAVKRNLYFVAPPADNAENKVIRTALTVAVVAPDEEKEYEIPSGRLREYPVYAGITSDAGSKDIFRTGPGLLGWDTAFVIKNVPVLLSNKSVFQYHKKWFASAGLFMNDYSGGIEVQFGIPRLYAVVNGSLIKEGLVRFGYGFGTAIPLKPAISATLSYTFSSLKNVEYDPYDIPYKATAQHHQAKLMANINLSGHFSLRVGPTLNYMNAYYRPEERPYTVAFVGSRATQTYSRSAPAYTEVVIINAPVVVKEYKATKSWVGFEAGISYRINFSIRK